MALRCTGAEYGSSWRYRTPIQYKTPCAGMAATSNRTSLLQISLQSVFSINEPTQHQLDQSTHRHANQPNSMRVSSSPSTSTKPVESARSTSASAAVSARQQLTSSAS
eukprot:1650885-Rhodomonas_salina.2